MEEKNGGVTLRACKNTLGRLKLQILFRLLFVCLGLIPLVTGFGAWRLWPIVLGTTLWAVPEALLIFLPEFAAGIFNTQRAYDCIGYDGFFPERKIDRLLADWKAGKKQLAICVGILAAAGFALNIRSLIRLCASFIDINCCLPRQNGKRAVLTRFLQGLGVIFTAFAVWFFLSILIGNGLSDLMGRNAKDPYRFHHEVSHEEEVQVLQRVNTALREENYFYYVNIPFNENGFAQLAEGKQSAGYLARISHATGTQQMWEFVLTLNEDRSAAWSDASAVVHPVRFDQEAQQETLYISGSENLTLHYRDESGAFVQVALEDAPQNYQIFAQYILLDAKTIDTMTADDEHLAADAAEDFIHVRFDTDDMRITIGIKDSMYPYEVAFRNGDFSYETIAIRFDATHSFTLP